MKDSAVLELAVKELTGSINEIMNSHNINPSLMRFVLGVVETKISDLAISELTEEVINLELKVEKTLSTDGTSAEEKGFIKPLSTDEERSGSIDDLITDLKSNGVNVEEKTEGEE